MIVPLLLALLRYLVPSLFLGHSARLLFQHTHNTRNMSPQETSGLLGKEEKIIGDNYEGIVINDNNAAAMILPHSQLSFGSSSDGDRTTETTYCRGKRIRMLPLALVTAAAAAAAVAIVVGSGRHFVVSHSKPAKHQQEAEEQPAHPVDDSKESATTTIQDSDHNNDVSLSNDAANATGSSSSSSLDAAATRNKKNFTGPYKLLEAHLGASFLDYYDFYEGADSLGSAGYNTYVNKQRAMELGLVQVLKDDEKESSMTSILLQSAPTADGPRESIRLEGKTRYQDRGLFLLDLDHMPTGCGVWPAVWLTDEGAWPNHGEVDFVEGIYDLSVTKTALHTSDQCSMYAHVPG